MSAPDEVTIVNLALSNIGNSALIESLDEKIPAARQGRLWYPHARQQVLEAHNWDFARKRLMLADHSEDPPSGRWLFRYQYPEDCIKARFIDSPAGRMGDPPPFEVEMASDASKSILADIEQAVLLYTFDQTLTTAFSPLFTSALSWYLAACMAPNLSGSRRSRAELLQIYNNVTRSAMASNAQEGMEDKFREAEWIRGRG